VRAILLGAIPLALVVSGGFVFGSGLLASTEGLLRGAGSTGTLLPAALLGAVAAAQLLWLGVVARRRRTPARKR